MAKLLPLVLTILLITAAADTAKDLPSPANKTVSSDLRVNALNQPAEQGQVNDDAADVISDDDSSEPVKVEPLTSPPRTFLSSKSLPAVQASAASPPTASLDSLEMTSAAMEAAMTKLMLGNSAFGATPMGGSVKKISDLVRKTMMPKVKAAHRATRKNFSVSLQK